jgi:prepilin-type N-terminal cleavage/methylation domain-containing protein
MTNDRRRAFTLIEVLVAISIVAILATIASYAFGTARRKGSDARRISDINTVMKAMNDAEREGLSLAGPCTGTGGPYRIDRCAFNPPPTEFAFDFTRMLDPSKLTTACTAASTGVCQYSIRGVATGVAATPSAYRIYFFTQAGTEALSAGVHMATPQGIQ